MLVQNAAYYIAHIAVANDGVGAGMARGIAPVAETYAGSEIRAALRGNRNFDHDTPPETARVCVGPKKVRILRYEDASPPTDHISARSDIFRRYRNVAFHIDSSRLGVFRKIRPFPVPVSNALPRIG